MKYNLDHIINIINSGEPVFIIRATDRLSISLIQHYLDLIIASGADVNNMPSLEETIEQFHKW